MMKKVCFMIGFACLSIMSAWSVSAQSPLLFVTGHFPPYVFCEEEVTEGHTGIDIEILSELFRRIEQPYTIQCFPWKRALRMVQNGEAAGVSPAFKKPEREAFAQFLEVPIHVSQYSVFVKRGHEFSFQTIDDLAGKLIGIGLGHSVSSDFDEAAKTGKFQVEEVSTPEQNFRKLLAERIDAYINNSHVVLYEAKHLGVFDQIVALPSPASEGRPAYLMISKSATIPERSRFMQRLNHALHEMWEDGTVERLTEQYLQ